MLNVKADIPVNTILCGFGQTSAAVMEIMCAGAANENSGLAAMAGTSTKEED